MRYDWIVNGIGPFELTEYTGLAAVCGALAITAPFVVAERTPRRITGYCSSSIDVGFARPHSALRLHVGERTRPTTGHTQHPVQNTPRFTGIFPKSERPVLA